MALKQPYGSGLAAGRLRESRAVRPGSRVHFFILDQNSKLLETMNSKQKSRLNLVKIQRVCPRGVRADPGIHPNVNYLKDE